MLDDYKAGYGSLFSVMARESLLPDLSDVQADEEEQCTCCDPTHFGDDENCPVPGHGKVVSDGTRKAN